MTNARSILAASGKATQQQRDQQPAVPTDEADTQDASQQQQQQQPKPPTKAEFGRFHVLTCLAGFLFMLFHTLIALSGMFINVRPYNCSTELPDQQQDSWTPASNNWSEAAVAEQPSLPWSEHQGFRSSLSVQYRLCSRGAGDLTNVAFMVGTIGGSLAAGPTSDAIGRMPCIIVGQLLAALASLASNYAPSLWLHLACRCLAGLCIMFAQCAIQVYGCEVHSPEHRGRFLASWSSGASVGTIAAALLAHLTRDHQLFVLASCCMAVAPLLASVCLPESPAWLAVRGRASRVEAALRRIDAINGRRRPETPEAGGNPAAVAATLRLLSSSALLATPPPPPLSSSMSSAVDATVGAGARDRSRLGEWRRLWTCQMVRLLGVLGLHGVCLGLNCFGFYFVMGSVIPDVCLYALLLGVTQLPYAFVLNLIPRRSGLLACGLLAGLITLGFGAVDHFLPPSRGQGYALASLGVFGCFCSTAAFNLLITVSAEHFPTAVRNTGLGICTFCLSCGSTLSPLVNFLHGAPLRSLLLACPLLLSNLLLGLVLAGVVGGVGKAVKQTDDEQLEKQQEEIEFTIKQ